MKELDDLLTKYGFIEQDFVDYDFKKIEKLIDFELPEDYKHYLNSYLPFNGFINKEYISLYSFNDILSFNAEIEGIDKHSKTILIGNNGASESIGLRFLGDSNYRAIIDQYVYDLEDQIEIGTSFSNMIERLEQGVEWFQ